MKLRAALCCCLFLASSALARESTDVIVMKNGDHLTGEIKGLSQGVLYISMNYILGTSDVQWSKVDHIESKQLFLVKTEGGAVYTGTLSTAEIDEGQADDDRSGGVVEQAGDAGTADGGADGPDVGTFLAAVQRPGQYRHHLFQGQPIDAVQPELGSGVPAGAVVGGRVI